jgi:LPXTG-motif cell wall-anchored protein
VAYTVEHYLEQPNGTYTLKDTEALSGTTGASVSGTARIYAGYTFDNTVTGTIESGNILGDGTLVLKLYYTANTDTAYKVEHYLEQVGGTYVLEDIDNVTGTTGATATAVANTYAGYTFDNTVASTVESGAILGDGSLTLELYYTANTDTAYKIEHYLEQADGTYAVEDTNTITGTTGASVSATANTYAGYTFDNSVLETLETGNILGDGSLTLKLYYTANTDTEYKVEHYLEHPNGTYVLEDTVNETGTTGHSVNADANNYAGYTLDTTVLGTKDSGVIAGDGTLVLKLYYTANTDTIYKVEHYLEQLDGTYVLGETETLAGMTGDTVSVYPKTYTGYESANLLSRVNPLFISGVIKGDGSLVFEIRYTLTRHSITYQPGDHGTFKKEVFTNVAYGSNTPELSVDITGNAGYEFTGWSPKVDKTVNTNSVYIATWAAKKDTTYIVEYYQQQKDGTYKLVESESMNGETDTNVLAEIKEYKGFKFTPTVKDATLGGVIKGDGSLVLRLYYDIERTFEYKPSTATPGQNSGTNTSNPSTAANGVSTSDQTNMNLMIMMLLASLGSIIILKKRKTN